MEGVESEGGTKRDTLSQRRCRTVPPRETQDGAPSGRSTPHGTPTPPGFDRALQPAPRLVDRTRRPRRRPPRRARGVVTGAGLDGGRLDRGRRPRQRPRHRDEPVGRVRLRRRPRLDDRPDPGALLRRHRAGHDRRDQHHGAVDEPRRRPDRPRARPRAPGGRRRPRRSLALRRDPRGRPAELHGVGPERHVGVPDRRRSAHVRVERRRDGSRLGDRPTGDGHLGECRRGRPRRRVRAVGPRAVVSRRDPCDQRHRRREPHRERGAARAVPARRRGVGDVRVVGSEGLGGAARAGRRGPQLRSRREPLLVRPHV
ncbi:unannotated protein [freshwater metagenome]|uniref:Unannotated protein n=1 Tax=freshwater metagenome TaxID=449393 RepID=A0A6J6EB50_9ZZZZ